MLEESCNTMDKKNNRQSPSAVQKSGNGNDSKRQQNNGENPGVRQFGGRRKDYGGKGLAESSPRRPTPQKNRNVFDKRPRSRGGGQYYQGAEGTAREDLTEEFPLEVDLVPGRKTNLNHLLNFTYAGQRSREKTRGRISWQSDSYHGYGRRKGSSKKMLYNKEQYLQANYQFIVKDDGDYSLHSVDPDVLVDWDAIELIRVFGQEVSSCPICLEQPTAAKMTRCGHIYCWPCILHYLALGEQTWRKCPICYEAVHEQDLKSTCIEKVPAYKVGQTITMQLMKKERGTIYAMPKNLWEKREGTMMSITDDNRKSSGMKILTANRDYIKNWILDVERCALEQKNKSAETSEVAFIDSALHHLQARQENLMRRKSSSSSVRDPAPRVSDPDPLKTSSHCDHVHSPSQNMTEYACAFSNEEAQESPSDELPQTDMPTNPASEASDVESLIPENALPLEEAAENLEIPHLEGDTAKHISDSFYFYQAEDGQRIFLHALNARCLVKEYGGLEHGPQTITAKIVEMESVFMTEELRRRLRYLSHLPLTSEFQVAELELRPPVLSRDTLSCFADDVEHRKRLRQKKVRQEKRWSKKIQEEERRRLGITPGMKIVKSAFCPQIVSENRPMSPTAKSDSSEQSLPSISSPIGSPLDGVTLGSSLEEDEGQQTSMSFAQMLRGGAKKTPLWPKVTEPKSEARPLTRDSDGSEEECSTAPVFQNSFGEAIQTALENLESGKEQRRNEDGGFKMEKLPGKKKKKQQKLLFTTSMARGGK
ncbi:RING finger protein 10-like isoform X2 [Ostrea edulis]|uniref:RING finger protein 10-like isoform X2 n=1 Tax=Ostrea edulis TaxID=37623 RepID=UPI0024AFA2F6|nr:RING finger protein 10-like isoform X2 [Ostrea edulis]